MAAGAGADAAPHACRGKGRPDRDRDRAGGPPRPRIGRCAPSGRGWRGWASAQGATRVVAHEARAVAAAHRRERGGGWS